MQRVWMAYMTTCRPKEEPEGDSAELTRLIAQESNLRRLKDEQLVYNIEDGKSQWMSHHMYKSVVPIDLKFQDRWTRSSVYCSCFVTCFDISAIATFLVSMIMLMLTILLLLIPLNSFRHRPLAYIFSRHLFQHWHPNLCNLLAINPRLDSVWIETQQTSDSRTLLRRVLVPPHDILVFLAVDHSIVIVSCAFIRTPSRCLRRLQERPVDLIILCQHHTPKTEEVFISHVKWKEYYSRPS